MKTGRLLAFLTGAAALTLPLLAYCLHVRYIGFPDGHATELERAERVLFQVFLWPSAAAGLGLITLGVAASRRGEDRRILTCARGYALFFAILSLVYVVLRSRLDRGTGG